MKSTLRRLALIGVAGAGLALTAVGVAGASTTAAAPNAQDRAWMVAAHQSNLTEITAGRAAQQKATTATVRQQGAEWIADHTRLDASLKQLAQKLGVTLPGTPNATQRAGLASVSAKSGSAFDAAWLKFGLTGHLQTRAATAKEIAGGSDPQVVAAAKTAAPVVQMHIDMLERTTGTSPTGVNAGTGGQAATTTGGIRTGWLLLGLGMVAAAGSITLLRPRRTVTS